MRPLDLLGRPKTLYFCFAIVYLAIWYLPPRHVLTLCMCIIETGLYGLAFVSTVDLIDSWRTSRNSRLSTLALHLGALLTLTGAMAIPALLVLRSD